MTNVSLVLGKEEQYVATPKVWAFHKANDIINGINVKLSNMFGGFAFDSMGNTWSDSEKLYLCGEFSHNTEEFLNIQKELIANTSGYAAKRFTKSKYKKLVREDFPEFRLQWMLWCVWQKCKGSAAFRRLLSSIPEDVILVENTTRDNGGTAEIWGCRNKEIVEKRIELEKSLKEKFEDILTKKDLKKKISIEINKINDIGVWVGQNNIGKILMMCKEALKKGVEPDIDYNLLESKNIYILGKKFARNC